MLLLLFAALARADSGDTSDACVELAFAPTACAPGETILVEVSDCGDGDWTSDTVTIQLSSETGVFATGSVGGDGVYRGAFTCPTVDCPGERVDVYAVVFDELGRQDWVFGGVDVSCEPGADDTGAGAAAAGCGCDTGGGRGGAALVLAGGMVALGRRRHPSRSLDGRRR